MAKFILYTLTRKFETQLKSVALFSIIATASLLSACQTTSLVSADNTQIVQGASTAPSQPSYADDDYLDEDTVGYADDYSEDYSYESNDLENSIPSARATAPTAPLSLPSANERYNESTIAEHSMTTPREFDESSIIAILSIPNDEQTPSAHDEYVVPQTTLPNLPSHNELLERARQNTQQRAPQVATDQTNLPAFRNLMQVGVGQLQSGNLTAAENSFTRAQRLAPRSSAVYFYLSQVALKKNQPRKAEAMARRGLNVSQDASRRRALWQLILKSGQAQNSSRVISEAQRALQ